MTQDTVDYPDIPMSETVGPQGRQAAALERIADALEQLVLERVSPSRTAQGPRGDIAPDQLPPPPMPSAAFIQSRDLPPEPFVNLASWTCPVHHKVKVVPAGVSAKTGKPYDAFMACSEPYCNEKPPRPRR